jgi:hypothetical protein
MCAWWPPTPEEWQAFSGVLTALAAGVGIWIALEGLKTWKRQLRGTEDHNMAKNILMGTMAVLDNFHALRDRNTTLPPGTPSERFREEADKVYFGRLVELSTAVNNLGLLLDKASILWGERFMKYHERLNSRFTDILFAFHDLSFHRVEPRSEEAKQSSSAFYGTEQTDPLRENLRACLQEIENDTRKKLAS